MFDLTTLMQFAEFEEEDGVPIEWCCGECGAIALNEEGWYSDTWHIGWCSAVTTKMKGDSRHAHCPQCGTLVGFTDDDRPYRIRLSRIVEALERSQAAIRIMEDGLREDAMMSDVRSTQHATLRRMCEYASKRAAGEVA